MRCGDGAKVTCAKRLNGRSEASAAHPRITTSHWTPRMRALADASVGHVHTQRHDAYTMLT
eukprot:CAMPEP_0169482132 /NCGR_PEP_ID=MMETSP1042-20121227/30511_1 /TAXON_ID=464988 /ORGANISM="Hemiselmis andersenii, Strain CCMP1180" /LENGTH=60 /DNA_ID=CAMNT_0009596977 /DNA_START=55 /DNA_END=233 /DNA_ORIENTATION=+